MQRTAVLNVVGLTPAMLGPAMPRLSAWARRGRMAPIRAITPAVTRAAQATYLTGEPPRRHGIVANGWYAREEAEIRFWKQSNRLIQSPKLWEVARAHDPAFTCANLFWWFNMYASVDFALTPRPMYPADGRKLPDLHSHPPALRHEAQARLGAFPLFNYWGPTADIRSSRWIAESARWIAERHQPTLTLVYLPHLDYGLQKLGPHHGAMAGELAAIDAVAGELIDFFEARGVQVVVLSEYGITPVSRPVRINQALRRLGVITVRDELGLAPDFARTVDIHRKPGYDPVELFIDPGLRFPQWRIARHLLKKAIGMRSLLEVIPLDDSLVRGSHGRPTDDPQAGPLFVTQRGELVGEGAIDATDVFALLLEHLGVDRHCRSETA